MKQKIYEIPIWDAFQLENCECALCSIEKKLEENFISSLFSEMVMDVRLNPQLVEDYDFCNTHFEKLYRYPDKCGLAVLTNRILYSKKQKLNTKENCSENTNNFPLKKLIFNKQKTSIKKSSKECMLCKKLNKDMNNYVETVLLLWVKDENFRILYNNCKGFCIKHYNIIMEQSLSLIKHQEKLKDFQAITFKLQDINLERIQEELEWFISKFDYRFTNEPWKTSKDALQRTIQKLIGNFNTKI